MPIFIL